MSSTSIDTPSPILNTPTVRPLTSTSSTFPESTPRVRGQSVGRQVQARAHQGYRGSVALFVGIRLGLGPMDRAGGVLRLRVHGVELQVDRALVHDVVARAGGDEDEATG